MAFEKKITCKNCGSEYDLYKYKLTMRDRDSEDCVVCGDELISWNGAVMYDAKLTKKGSIETVKKNISEPER